MSKVKYDIPSNPRDLFEKGESSYSIIDYVPTMEMDNNQSMQYFLECVGITDEMIVDNSGTQVIIDHHEYDFSLCIDAGGLGDFFSHGYDVTIIQNPSIQ